MAFAAELEIGKQMQSVKKEWKETVASMDEKRMTAPPRGLSRSEVLEWRQEQGKKARERLVELETRLTRLQMLGGKIQQLQTTAREAATVMPEMWEASRTSGGGGLPDNHVPYESSTFPPPSRRPMQGPDGTYPPPGHQAWGGAEGRQDWDSSDMQTQQGGLMQRSMATGGPMARRYSRPMTPGTVRNIIREEVSHESCHPSSRRLCNLMHTHQRLHDVLRALPVVDAPMIDPVRVERRCMGCCQTRCRSSTTVRGVRPYWREHCCLRPAQGSHGWAPGMA